MRGARGRAHAAADDLVYTHHSAGLDDATRRSHQRGEQDT